MIINSSHISMDASSGHKDVNQSKDGRLLSRNHSGTDSPHFNLGLSRLHFPEKSASTQLQEARHTETSAGGQQASSAVAKADEVISRAIEELAGSKVRLRKNFPDYLFNGWLKEQARRLPHAQKRYYHLGGQQFSLTFAAHRVHYEYEYMNFSSSGSIVTADGKDISFSLNLSMHRTTMVQESLLASVKAGYFIDPLVLNFDNGLERLHEQSFLFDLDNDGEKEKMPGLASGNGFLALDIDRDGLVSCGRELFGPSSGSGFADLAIHDIDHNNWIDENDPIFSKLKVWMNPGASTQDLISLKDAGVGAISLANTGSLFNLKSAENRLLGQVSASGIFLTENGEVKSIQDLTMALEDREQEEPLPKPDQEGANEAITSLHSMIAARRRDLEERAARQTLVSKKEHKRETWWDFLRLG